jgi:hypothetical protein
MTEKEMSDKIYELQNCLFNRIATTKKTLPNVFDEVDKYISAAFAIYEVRSRNLNDRNTILRCQMLALKLTTVIPLMLSDIEKELLETINKEETKE